MTGETLTLFREKQDEKLLDTALGLFDGQSEDIVIIKERQDGYVIAVNKLQGETYEQLWESEKFIAKYFNVLAADINKDGRDELIVGDSHGIKVCRWDSDKMDIDAYELIMSPNVFLGTTKLQDKGMVLVVISEIEIVYFRVGKTGLEEVGKEEVLLPIRLALTADIDEDGSNEILLYYEAEERPYLAWYKITAEGLKKSADWELEDKVSSLASGLVRKDTLGIYVAQKNGLLSTNKIKDNNLIKLAERSFPDDESLQLLAEVTGPGLVALRFAPGVNRIRIVRAFRTIVNKILVVTEKGRVLLGGAPRKSQDSLFRPVTLLDRDEETHQINVNGVIKIDGKLLDIKTMVASLDEKVSKGKVNLSGKVDCRYLYTSNSENKICAGEDEIPFSTTIEKAEIGERDWVDVIGETLETKFKSVDGGYEVEAQLAFNTQYLKQKEVNLLTVLTDKRLEQFVETTIQVEEPVSRGRLQTVVKGTLTTDIPVEKVLEANARVRNLQVESLFNQAVVSGVLEVEVLFVADTLAGDQPVFFIEGTIPFTVTVSVPGLRPGMQVFINPIIEFVKANLIGPKTIEVTAILALTVGLTVVSPLDVIIDVNGSSMVGGISEVTTTGLEIEFPVGVTPVQDIIARGQNQVLIEEEVDIPPQKPDVEYVLSVDATVRVTETRVIPDKVIIRGILRTTTRYVAATMAGDQPVHAVSEDLHFTAFVDLRGVAPGTPVTVIPQLEYIKGRKEDSRTIDITAIVKFIAQAFRPVGVLAQTDC